MNQAQAEHRAPATSNSERSGRIQFHFFGSRLAQLLTNPWSHQMPSLNPRKLQPLWVYISPAAAASSSEAGCLLTAGEYRNGRTKLQPSRRRQAIILFPLVTRQGSAQLRWDFMIWTISACLCPRLGAVPAAPRTAQAMHSRMKGQNPALLWKWAAKEMTKKTT